MHENKPDLEHELVFHIIRAKMSISTGIETLLQDYCLSLVRLEKLS